MAGGGELLLDDDIIYEKGEQVGRRTVLLVFWRLGGDSELLLVADMEVATEERAVDDGRRTVVGLLTLGWWGSGSTACARCCFCFLGRHFLKRGGSRKMNN